MKLPKLAKKTEKEVNITKFGGLNMTHGAKEGELAAAENLSVTAAPALAVRSARGVEARYASATSLYSWDGLVVIDGNAVLYDGEPVGAVTEGEKQFAVVGDKLCIFPDKVYVNVRDRSFGRLDSVVITPWNGVTLTNTAVKVTDFAYTKTCTNAASYVAIPRELLFYNTYTAVSWKNGVWTRTGAKYTDLQDMAAGQIVIPTRQSGSSYAWRIDIVDDQANITENDDGYYGVIKSFDSEYWLKDGVIVCSLKNIVFDVYSAGTETSSFTGLFSVGDTVTVSGIVTGAAVLDNTSNTLTANGKHTNAEYISTSQTMSTDRHIGRWVIIEGTRYYVYDNSALRLYLQVSDTDDTHARVTCTNGTKIWPGELQPDVVATVSEVSENQLTFSENVFTAGTNAYSMTISRSLPDLDYICSDGTRLWGCSNKDRVIYASCTLSPDKFEGGDSIVISDATKEDFTGCIAYGGDILFFKETEMLRISQDGTRIDRYDMAGVEKGAWRTMRIINEKLYYKGVNGIYVYSGTTPEPVVMPFGDERYTACAAGENGARYYISLQDTSGDWSLFVCDLETGRWMREDQLRASGFAYLGGRLYMCGGGSVYVLEDERASRSGVSWRAELPAFSEGSHDKKTYRWLRISANIEPGAELRAEVSFDGGEKQQVFSGGGPGYTQLDIPLPANRCSVMQVVLSGVGGCEIYSVGRVYTPCGRGE